MKTFYVKCKINVSYVGLKKITFWSLCKHLNSTNIPVKLNSELNLYEKHAYCNYLNT